MKSLQAIVATGALLALAASPVLAQTSGSGPKTAPGQSSEMTRPSPGDTTKEGQPGSGAPSMTQPRPGEASKESGTSSKDRGGDTGRTSSKDAAGSMEKNGSAGGEKMNARQVRRVQEALKQRGLDPGPIDGIFGPRTRQAVRDFQKQENIAETGQLSPETLEKLGVGAA